MDGTGMEAQLLPSLTDRLLATYCGALPTEEVRECLIDCETELLASRSAGVSADALEAMARRRLTDRIATRRIA